MTVDSVPQTARALRSAPFAWGRFQLGDLLPGLLVCTGIGMGAAWLSSSWGGPVMVYALCFGIAFHFLSARRRFAPGIAFASRSVLRIGVALLGVRIAWGDLASLGWTTVALVVSGVAVTIVLGYRLGRLFRLPPDFAVLCAGSVAICGASAALAISAVLPKHQRSERNTLMAVVGVTTLSTVAMVLYPLIVSLLGFDDTAAGVFIGATVHDVAQVVGAGYTISAEAGDTATLVKLIRVACLVPVVVALPYVVDRGTAPPADPSGEGRRRPPLLPWFLLGFVLLAGANSLGLVAAGVSGVLGDVSRWCLVTAVAGLGVKTSLGQLYALGSRPVSALVAQTAMLAVYVGLLLVVLR